MIRSTAVSCIDRMSWTPERLRRERDPFWGKVADEMDIEIAARAARASFRVTR